MRSSAVQRAWERAVARDRRFTATSLSTSGKRPLADLTCELPNGLVIICGLNGVGKTTLLRLIAEALGGGITPLRDELRKQGTFELKLNLDGKEMGVPPADKATVFGAFLDAADQCNHLLTVAQQPNFEDLSEGIDSYEWTPAEVADAQFVVGKPYTAIRLTEIEDPVPVARLRQGFDSGEPDIQPGSGPDDEGLLPLLEVDVDGTTYDFRTMGLGELAALTLLWRLQQSVPNSVVLLEEPETFLSARASAALMSILARTVDSKRLYAVVTTHSPGLIRGAPLSSIRILKQEAGRTALRHPKSSAELEYVLGLPSGSARVVLVEDQAARDFVRELVGRFAEGWASDFEFLITEGEEALVSICKKFPESNGVRIVGVLDGDQKLPEPPPRWPVLSLPGPENPDSLLRAAALEDLQQFAELCGRDLRTVESVCHVRAGEDEHDWFHSVSSELILDLHVLRRITIEMYLRKGSVEARELVTRILAVLTDGGYQAG